MYKGQIMKQSNLLIKNNSGIKLIKLNEAEEGGFKRYKFTGCFTQCSEPDHKIINRNGRIYMSNEVIKHLGYLRDKIKNDGCLLGELDHPEGRFEISLKEASHKITDLWYDQASHQVRGTIELLDTPNGQIAKSLVDSGFPIFVSSRAAGDVDPKTKEVEIAQIFTYDIVCTPGFEEARLERMNESLKPKAKKFLLESASKAKEIINENRKYGIDDDSFFVKTLDQEYRLNEEDLSNMNKKVNLKDICSPLNEEDTVAAEQKPEQENNNTQAAKFGVETRDLSPTGDNLIDENDELLDDDSADSKSEPVNEETDKEKEDKKEDILDIEPEHSSKSDKAKDILEVEPEFDGGNLDDSEETESGDNEDSEEESKEEEANEEAECESTKSENKKLKKLSKETEKDMDDIEKLLKDVEKKKEVKESIYQRYPFTISLSPENFARFTQLSEEQRNLCNNYIIENQIFDIYIINEHFMDALAQEKLIQENWLRLASEYDKNLYFTESAQVQNAIAEQAKFFEMNTQKDVDEFWNRIGLRQKRARKINEQEFGKKYKEMFTPETYSNDLGYSSALPQLIESMLSE